LLITPVCLFAFACGDAGDTQSPTSSTGANAPPGGCFPGEYEPCECSDGTVGIQECLEGDLRGECNCDDWGNGPPDWEGGTNPQDGIVVLKLPVTDVVADPNDDILYGSVVSPADPYSDSVIAVSPTTGEILWSVEVGDRPGPIAIANDSSTIYVGLREPPAVVKIDVATHAQTAKYTSLGPEAYPYALAVRPDHANQLLVITSDVPEIVQGSYLVMLEDGVEVSIVHVFLGGPIFAGDAATAFLETQAGGDLTTFDIGPDGSLIEGTKTQGLLDLRVDGYPNRVAFDGERFYGDNGAIANTDHMFVGKTGLAGSVAVDVANDRLYVCTGTDEAQLEVNVLSRSTLAPTDKKTFADVRQGRCARTKGGTLGVIQNNLGSPYRKDLQLTLISPKLL
jgi:hypothetical protein